MNKLLAHIKENAFTILQGNKLGEMNIIADATEEQLNAIGIRYVIFPKCDDNQMYSGEYELVDGEVYAIIIEKPIVEVPPIVKEMMFDSEKARKKIETLFLPKFLALAQYNYTINQNLISRNFARLKQMRDGLLAAKLVTQLEADDFTAIFMEQNIDINTY